MTRTRRPHKKSRHGCLGCKQRRKKCDEGTPRCSRCTEWNIVCEYPKISREPGLITRLSQQAAVTRQGLIFSNTPACVIPSICGHQLLLSISLSPTEIDHLSHYLTHTARAIAYDDDDLYALQVGFPSLALRNKPLMNSILALAAVCKCHDIITSTQMASLEDQKNVSRLLDLGDARHRASLRQTREESLNMNYYDCVLANAPLMVLFGFASHSLRIRLAQLLAVKGPLARGFVPGQSQWVSLIRAAHLAYTASLGAQFELSRDVPETWPANVVMHTPILEEVHEDNSCKDGPTRETRRFLLPIIRATSGPALKRLGLRAQIVQESLKGDTQPLNGSRLVKVKSCLDAFEVLRNIMDRVFHDVNSSPPTAITKNFVLTAGLDQIKNAHMSPWLRNYLARVTSAAPPKPLRRIITSFLNRTPVEYLNLVQSTIDDMPGQAFGSPDGHVDEKSMDGGLQELAMDVFAHWLVLMMLLDGVWWIGETGNWELKRIISLAHHRGWFEEVKENWWPESMHRIVTESKKHMVDS